MGMRIAGPLRRHAKHSVRDNWPDLRLAASNTAPIHEPRVRRVEPQLRNDELRRTRLELARWRDDYRDLLEQSPVGYVLLDGRGAIIEANHAAGVLLRQEATTLAGQPLSRFVAAADAACWCLHVRKMSAGLSAHSCELRLRRGEESFAAHLLSAVVPGKTRICRTAIIDLVDLRRADRRHDLAAIVEASGDPILSAGIDGEVLTWNPAAASLFGYSEAEAVGQSLGLLVPRGHEGSEHLQWDRVWNGERNLRQETTCRHKDGRLLHVWLAMAPVFDAPRGSTRIVIIARDISERVHREETLRRLARAVTDAERDISPHERIEASMRRRSETMEALGRLASGVAHDLNNYLMGIIGCTGSGLFRRVLPRQPKSF